MKKIIFSIGVSVYCFSLFAQTPIADLMLEMNQESSYFGVVVEGAGDINGDGYDDLMVCSFKYDYINFGTGAAFIYYGSPTGINNIPDDTLSNNITDSEFGLVASSAGDLNADGYDDLIISAPAITTVYVYLGSATGIIKTPIAALDDLPISYNFGEELAGGGDVNNDGYDDIVIGAPTYTSGQYEEGCICVYHGSASGINLTMATLIQGNQASANFGSSVAIGMSVNGDEYDDLIVGALRYDNGNTDEGRTYVFNGSASGINPLAVTTLEVNQTSANFGSAVASIGDINNDGFGDIASSAPSYDNVQSSEGLVKVYLGGALGINAIAISSIESNKIGAYLGNQISSIGDVNNDNFDDLLVGCVNYSNGEYSEGGAYLFYGSVAGFDIATAIIYESNFAGAYYGRDVTFNSDLNGDGYSDIAIGASSQTNPDFYEGAAYVYYSTPLCALDTFFRDNDFDSYGDINNFIVACEVSEGYVSDNTDCNDLSNTINTMADELCNSLDDNCNGLIDDGISETISISAGGPISFCQGGSVLLTATYSGASVQWKKNGTNIPGATGATYNVTTKGNYTCVTTSACGTVESTPIFVNVIKNPNASISAGGPTTFCAGGSVILTEVAVAGCTYQWYKGASPIAGATSLTYTATTSGNYKCRVTKAATGCFKNSNAIAVSVPCREGEMINDEKAFSIYPNPNKGAFTIEAIVTTQNFASLESTIEIYNNLGQLIFSKKIICNDGIINEAIELKNITPGIYLVKLWNNNIYNVKNIIIE
ncbi:MAG: FG-GAP repeat protein [Bacteroidetes bacterium]|nr:FG-GAP repeat protein [Bacteroidota bacterium]